MEEEMPFESELVTRIAWLIRLRWIAVIGTGSAIGLAAHLLPGELETGSLLVLSAAIAVYNLLFAVNLRSVRLGPAGKERLRQATTLASLQIVLDLLALAVLVHFSGGLENPMVMFFTFHVIIACILLRRAVAFVMTGLAVALVSGLAILEHAGLVRHYHLSVVPGDMYRTPLALIGCTLTIDMVLVIAAFLTSSITARLRQRDALLLQSRASCLLRSEELSLLNAELQRVDAERTRFIVLVTHELRAPVATIHSALELVRGGYTTSEETEEMLGRAQRRASELLALIRDLLDLSRVREAVSAGGLESSVAPLQLASLLRETADFMGPEIARHGLTLDLSVPEYLGEVRIPADQARLIWTNLLSNAVKYSRPGGVIQIALSQDASSVVGRVSDTGIGIASDDLPHVFDEFFRASNAKLASPHGSGVGMATVRRIVENWGGRIDVESELGKGTMFRFSLPRVKADGTQHPAR
ncbi:MAG TPA: HAMP domain-containing sensor histidine kinase [Anaerolineae bacterium]|nr:HAMP domain-containing sensor histidine kinase [Anaerolineae bacterium]